VFETNLAEEVYYNEVQLQLYIWYHC